MHCSKRIDYKVTQHTPHICNKNIFVTTKYFYVFHDLLFLKEYTTTVYSSGTVNVEYAPPSMRQVTVTEDVVSTVGDSPGELSQPPAMPVMWSDNGGKSSHAHTHAHTQVCIKHLLKGMHYMLHISIYPMWSLNHFYLLYTVCFYVSTRMLKHFNPQ